MGEWVDSVGGGGGGGGGRQGVEYYKYIKYPFLCQFISYVPRRQ
jgi:hypothetical protein